MPLILCYCHKYLKGANCVLLEQNYIVTSPPKLYVLFIQLYDQFTATFSLSRDIYLGKLKNNWGTFWVSLLLLISKECTNLARENRFQQYIRKHHVLNLRIIQHCLQHLYTNKRLAFPWEKERKKDILTSSKTRFGP
mgnify:FL=1